MKHYLGIDPSTVSTGYAVFDEEGSIVDCGKLVPTADMTHVDKVLFFHNGIKEVVGKHNIVRIFCEDQYAGPSVDTLKKLSHVRGIMMLIAAEKGIPFHLCYPAQWRKVFHGEGHGNAKKDETITLVNERYNMNLQKKDNDVADAIGIAYMAMVATEGEVAG